MRPECPAGIEPALSSLEGWYLCQSATGTCRRKGRESNPQGREAHPASNGVPSPLGLPFRKAAAAGIEPASARLTAAHPYQHGNHRITSVRTAGFEPAVSCAQSRRIARLSYVLKRTRSRERPAGVEPALPPWQGDRLPLHHGRRGWKPNCQRTQSTGRDSNPRHRSTGAASSPLDHQCVSFSGTSGARTRTRLVKSQGCCR